MNRPLSLTLLAVAGVLCACRILAPSDYFTDNFTPWHYVQQAPPGYTESDLAALDIPADLHFTDKKTGDIIYVFRRHHTPHYQGAPDKQLAEVWRFDAETRHAKGIYTYQCNRKF